MRMQTDGTVLVLQGDFDARSTWEVRDALYDLLEGHERDVVVDLTDVVCADVTALRVLAAATRYAYREGHRVRLRGATPAVRRLLHLSRLIRVVELDRRVSPSGARTRPLPG